MNLFWFLHHAEHLDYRICFSHRFFLLSSLQSWNSTCFHFAWWMKWKSKKQSLCICATKLFPRWRRWTNAVIRPQKQIDVDMFANVVTWDVVLKSQYLLTKLLQMCVWPLFFTFPLLFFLLFHTVLKRTYVKNLLSRIIYLFLFISHKQWILFFFCNICVKQ